MTARVDLVQLIQRATEFARLWRMQDGCSATVLDELADAIEGYVGDREVTPSAYYCPECATKRPLADPCKHVDIEPGTLRRVRELFGVPIDDPVRDRVHVREATDDEQREALDRGLRQRAPAHIELFIQQVLPLRGLFGRLILRNDSTVELEVVTRDGTSIGLPPSAVGEMGPGDTVRTPPGEDWTRPRAVSYAELAFAQRLGRAAHQRGSDYLWAQRLPDGRGVFLMPWRLGGVQLSVGTFGDLTFHGTWYYDAENADVGWRDALGWDVGQREPHSLKGVPR